MQSRLTSHRDPLRPPLRAKDPTLLHLALCVLLCTLSHPAHAQQPPPSPDTPLPNAPGQQSLGTITGTITDPDGASITAARITLTANSSPTQATFSSLDGTFSFASVPSGPFKLSIAATGFLLFETSGNLQPGQSFEFDPIALPTASTTINMQITATQQEIAEDQIHLEEKQRVLGFIPNFYVVYDSLPVPLTPRQKYELAWRSLLDPMTFAGTGFGAGIQQAANQFTGYGQGAQGYAKRYAANFGNILTGTMLGGAILPALFKQDPRYYYKGTGSIDSRIGYALANALVCKGDNQHWQFNYSGILGSAASGALSNLYYPAADREGATLTVETTLLSIGGSAVSNLFQEFLVRKLTPHVPHSTPANP